MWSLLFLRLWRGELWRPQQPSLQVESQAEADDQGEHLSEIQNPEELWDTASRRGTERAQPHPRVRERKASPAPPKRYNSEILMDTSHPGVVFVSDWSDTSAAIFI